jgi:hypothetical protein
MEARSEGGDAGAGSSLRPSVDLREIPSLSPGEGPAFNCLAIKQLFCTRCELLLLVVYRTVSDAD